MDIRGVEITNQLRSAIRAKLLELGVRYDEELPDYILVMVVNKKSREQMNEDLNLFLEDSTEPFVDWLHDQVLKKLQKVTVAKKKTNKDVTSTTIVKQEDDMKQPKIEDQPITKTETPLEDVSKCERDREFEELVGDLAMLNEEDSQSSFKESQANEEKSQKTKSPVHDDGSGSNSSSPEKRSILSSVSIPKPFNNNKVAPSHASPEKVNTSSQSLKRMSNDNPIEETTKSAKRTKFSNDSDSENDNRVKSSISKPKVTSVVSVKTRLGGGSPSKKQESQTKSRFDSRVSNKNHTDVKKNEIFSQRNRSKSIDRWKPRSEDLRNDLRRDNKQQVRNSNNEKSNRIEDFRDKERLNNKSGTIKSRLGINTSKHETAPLKSTSSTKVSKPRISNVKSRLGVRNKQTDRELMSKASRLSLTSQHNNFEEVDDDAESVINTSLKSHIIAVKTSKTDKHKEKGLQTIRKSKDLSKNVQIDEDIQDEIEEYDVPSKVPSKIIVTPRPLKPLRPAQKRATQSLLLKAVAEANQSVVMQKKIDPCLKEQKEPKTKVKITRDPWEGKILSVSLNAKKRMVMEKIQIELANSDKMKSKTAHSSQKSQIVTDEHMDVVKSLFKRTDDKQKFLVTLNGYNNNILKDRNSDNEEHSEIEIIDDDDDEVTIIENPYEYANSDQIMVDNYNDNVQNHNQDHDMTEEFTNSYTDKYTVKNYKESKNEHKEHNNVNEGNVKVDDSSSKNRRKLSPIVYTRSRSHTPEKKPTIASTVTSVLRIDKRPLVSSVITTVADKSSEKCRYWPNCTLGIKCAYYHPDVLCSSFPACKFGEKCAYKHPKCKFGSACTKLGCMFSHPPVQCKYHPYCMKPGCPFSHPKTSSSSKLTAPLTPDMSTVRAKFTWKKKE